MKNCKSNPWRNIRAFEPMYTDVIQISAKRGSETYEASFDACVFPIADVDPFIDIDNENNLKKISINIKISDFSIYHFVPKIGDEILVEYEEVYKILKVEKAIDDFVIVARAKK